MLIFQRDFSRIFKSVTSPRAAPVQHAESASQAEEQGRKNQGITDASQALSDLDNFLTQEALNEKQQKTGKTVESYLKENKNKSDSYYQIKYCPEFLEIYQSLSNFKKNKEKFLDIPSVPENYCEKFKSPPIESPLRKMQ